MYPSLYHCTTAPSCWPFHDQLMLLQDNQSIIPSASKHLDDRLPIVLPKPLLAPNSSPGEQHQERHTESKDQVDNIAREISDNEQHDSNVTGCKDVTKESQENDKDNKEIVDEYKDSLDMEMIRLNDVPNTQKTSHGLSNKIEKLNPHDLSSTAVRCQFETQDKRQLPQSGPTLKSGIEITDNHRDGRSILCQRMTFEKDPSTNFVDLKISDNRTVGMDDTTVVNAENIFKPIVTTASQVPVMVGDAVIEQPALHKDSSRILKRNENSYSPASPQSRRSEDSCYGNRGIMNYSCVEIFVPDISSYYIVSAACLAELFEVGHWSSVNITI